MTKLIKFFEDILIETDTSKQTNMSMEQYRLQKKNAEKSFQNIFDLARGLVNENIIPIDFSSKSLCGIADVAGVRQPFIRVEGFIYTYEIYKCMKKTAWVRVTKNNSDAGNWGDKEKKLHKCHQIERIRQDVKIKISKDNEDRMSVMFKNYVHEQILEKTPKKMPIKRKVIIKKYK